MKYVSGFYLPDSDTYFADILTEKGFQIERLIEALKYVDNFRLAIDGGAHVGTWSKFMASQFNEVYSFEPCIETYECLNRNVSLCDNVHTFNVALGKKESKGNVCIDKSRIGNTGSNYIELDDNGSTIIKTIDDYDFRYIDFIKLDLEGMEYEALQGAEKNLKNHKPVIMIECKGNIPRVKNDEHKKALEYLKSLGYKVVDVFGKDFVLRSK